MFSNPKAHNNQNKKILWIDSYMRLNIIMEKKVVRAEYWLKKKGHQVLWKLEKDRPSRSEWKKIDTPTLSRNTTLTNPCLLCYLKSYKWNTKIVWILNSFECKQLVGLGMWLNWESLQDLEPYMIYIAYVLHLSMQHLC